MGRIPEFTRRQLASSAVGTPGIDRSGERIGQSIAVAADKVSRDLRRKQDALDAIDANQKIIDFELDYGDEIRQIKSDFADDPIGGVEAIRKAGTKLSPSFLNQIRSDNVRQSVARMQQGVIKRQTLKAQIWANNQQVANAGVKMKNVARSLAIEASQEDTVDGLSDILKRMGDSEIAAQGLLGAEADTFINEGTTEIAKSFIYGQLDRKPINAGALLSQGAFDEILTLKEVNGFKEDARKAIETKIDNDKFQAVFDGYDADSEIIQEYQANTLTVGKIDIAKQELLDRGTPPEQLKFYDAMREILLDNTTIDAVDNAEEYSTLMDEWHQLQVDTKGLNATGSLENILRFRRNASESHRRKVITKEKFNKFIELTATPLARKIEDEQGDKGWLGFGGPASALDAGYVKINNWLGTNNLSENFNVKKNMLVELVERFDAKARTGEIPTFRSMNEIAQTIIEEEQIRINPALNNIPDKGKLIMDPKGRKLRIFKDGTSEKVK